MISKLKHIIIASIALVVLALLPTSCITDVECEGLGEGVPTLTLLVYLAGDNNLSPIGQIPETLRQVWKYTGNRCLIYYDVPDGTPKLLSLRGGCASNPVPYIETIAEYPEENSASASVFSRVMSDVERMYPADSYGLLFCSHGSGWLPGGALANPMSRSIGLDKHLGTVDSGSEEMELSDFAAAIPDHHFDFIIFESCLMAGVEVAYELRNKTDYILASSAELLSPGFLKIYKNSFGDLMNTKLSIEERLKRMGQNYYSEMNAHSGSERSATLSLIRTNKMEELAVWANEIIKNITGESDLNIHSLQHFDRPGSYGDSPVAPRFFDFGEYMEHLAEPKSFAVLSGLINDIVIWKATTPYFMEGENGFQIRHYSGMTTYIQQDIFPDLNVSWQQTAWGKVMERRE